MTAQASENHFEPQPLSTPSLSLSLSLEDGFLVLLLFAHFLPCYQDSFSFWLFISHSKRSLFFICENFPTFIPVGSTMKGLLHSFQSRSFESEFISWSQTCTISSFKDQFTSDIWPFFSNGCLRSNILAPSILPRVTYQILTFV